MTLPNEIAACLRRGGMIQLGEPVHAAPLPHVEARRLWRVDASGRSFAVKLVKPLKAPRANDGAADGSQARRLRFEVASGDLAEALYLDLVSAVRPDAVPALHRFDETLGALVMDWVGPAERCDLLSMARAGELRPEHAFAAGRLLAELHRAFSGRANVARTFAADGVFVARRVEPLLLGPAERHKELSRPLKRLAHRVMSTKRTLIHGEPTLENLLPIGEGLQLLDADAARYGEPAFDLALVLADLTVLARSSPDHAEDLDAAAEALAVAYFARAPEGQLGEPSVEALAGELLPGLVLGRVEGAGALKGVPTAAREKLRRRSAALLTEPVTGLAAALSGMRLPV